MDTRRLTFFVNVSTVLLIHEVLFVKCDLKTKTHDYLAKTRVDGFRRHGRQAPIDPSRMYLPPDKNAIASAGFGGPADAPNNFDGNNNNNNNHHNNGYGATAGPVPNAYRAKDGPWTENGDYDLSTRTTNGLNGVQTVGPYGTVASGGWSPSGGNDYGRVSGEYNNGGGNAIAGRKPTADGGYSGTYNGGPTSPAPDDLDGRNRPGKGASQGGSLRASDNYAQPCLLGGNDRGGRTSTNNGYDRGGLSDPTADGFGRGQPPPEPGHPPRTSDGYGRDASRTPSSGRGDRGQSNPSANGAYGRSVSGTETNGHTRADTGGEGEFGSSRPGTSTGHGRVGTCGPPSAGSPTDPGRGVRDRNKHSTIVPKDQYQNSNLPDGGFETQTKDTYGSTTNANGDEPGSNAFSNFAPGNRPDRPPTNVGGDASYGGDYYGEPGVDAFSNFAPNNRPDRPQPISPSNIDCDQNSNRVNDASKLTEAVFPSSNAGY